MAASTSRLKVDVESDFNNESSDAASLDHLSEGNDELKKVRMMKLNRKKKLTSKVDIDFSHIFESEMIDDENPIIDEKENIEPEYTSENEKPIFEEDNEQAVIFEREDRLYLMHNPNTHWKLKKPILGERYASMNQLKDCLIFYAVANGYQLYYEKSDAKLLIVKCGLDEHKRKLKGLPVDPKTVKCPFRLRGVKMNTEVSYQVRSLVDKHLCSRQFFMGSLISCRWIAEHFEEEIKVNPEMKATDLQELVMKKYIVKVSRHQCSRAKIMALYNLKQNVAVHYARLWDYGAELRRSNPGSTIKMSVDRMSDGRNVFSRYYVCFQELKEGWKSGCRKVIGFDGCFLKGICKGELLSAIGRDGNNQIYPIAWAVVDVENTKNWEWFLQILREDIELNEGDGLTILSDGHKGLIEAVKRRLPNAEHRLCARHVYANFRKIFSGVEFRHLFWSAAKSSYVRSFENIMNQIKHANVDAYTYLMKKEPSTWSRAYFKLGVDCDAVENGLCESFNGNCHILNARKKPIIGMFEDIRKYVMDRNNDLRIECETWEDEICPNIRKILELNKRVQRKWAVLPSNMHEFEVRQLDAKAFTVRMDMKTCSCRMWQLSGIPCPHAIATMCKMHVDPDKYVSDHLKISKYKSLYKYNIKPVEGMDQWEKLNHTPPLPPRERQMPGRPTIKRKKDRLECHDTMVRPPRTMTCQNCLESGHNQQSCKKPKVDKPISTQDVNLGRPLVDYPVNARVRSNRGGRGGRGAGRGREGRAQGGKVGRGDNQGVASNEMDGTTLFDVPLQDYDADVEGITCYPTKNDQQHPTSNVASQEHATSNDASQEQHAPNDASQEQPAQNDASQEQHTIEHLKRVKLEKLKEKINVNDDDYAEHFIRYKMEEIFAHGDDVEVEVGDTEDDIIKKKYNKFWDGYVLPRKRGNSERTDKLKMKMPFKTKNGVGLSKDKPFVLE